MIESENLYSLSKSEIALVGGGNLPDPEEVKEAVEEIEEAVGIMKTVYNAAKGYFTDLGLSKTATVAVSGAVTVVVVTSVYLLCIRR